MIKLRLFGARANSKKLFTLLEEHDLPDLKTPEDFATLAAAYGNILRNYQSQLIDPSIVASLNDTTITNWTMYDFKALNSVLEDSKLAIVITDESVEVVTNKPDTYYYLLVDNFNPKGTNIPVGTIIETAADDDVVESVDKSLPFDQFYATDKFRSNSYKELISTLREAKSVLGTYDQYTLMRYFDLLATLGYSLYLFSNQ